MGADRGFTYSEQHRHECEVRHVLALSTRHERADYIAVVTKRRGDAAGERMRTDLSAAWAARRHPNEPRAPKNGVAHAFGAVVHLNGARTKPVHGSFLVPSGGGDSDLVRCVVSGAPA